jgi:hypothetical protein
MGQMSHGKVMIWLSLALQSSIMKQNTWLNPWDHKTAAKTEGRITTLEKIKKMGKNERWKSQ